MIRAALAVALALVVGASLLLTSGSSRVIKASPAVAPYGPVPATPGACGGNTMVVAYRADGLGASSWPDTSGNGHNLTLGAGSWPSQISTFSSKSRAAARFNGSSALTAASTSASSPYYMYAWAQNQGATGKRFWNTRASLDGVSADPLSSTTIRMGEAGITANGYSDGTAQYFETTVNGASSNVRVNSTDTSGTIVTVTFDAVVLGALSSGGLTAATVDIAEWCVSATNQNTAMRSYGTSYYGLPYLLRRDVDPDAANDNRPMWLDAAA